MKKLLALSLSLAMALSLAACSSSSSTTTTTESTTTTTESTTTEAATETAEVFKIALSIDDISTDFASLLVSGCQSAAEEYGFEFEVRDAATDASTQTAQVENLITLGYDAILLKPSDESACGAISEACEEAGVPLIVLAAVLPSYYTTAISVDDTMMGEVVAQTMIEELGEEFSVVVSRGPLTAATWNTRYEGFMNYIADYEGITVLAESYTLNQRSEALELVTTWISAGHDFDAIYGSTDATAIGAAMACEDAGLDMDEVFIMGGTASYDGLTYMDAGLVDAEIYLTGFQYGSAGCEAALALLNGEELPTLINMDSEVLVAGNDRFEEVYAIEKAAQEAALAG